LEEQIQREREERRTERFFWIFALTIAFDAILFSHIGWAGSLAIFLLELIFLIGMAKWMGIDIVVVLLQRLLDKYLADKSKNDE